MRQRGDFQTTRLNNTTEKEVVEKGKEEIIRKFTKYNGSNADDRDEKQYQWYLTIPSYSE